MDGEGSLIEGLAQEMHHGRVKLTSLKKHGLSVLEEGADGLSHGSHRGVDRGEDEAS